MGVGHGQHLPRCYSFTQGGTQSLARTGTRLLAQIHGSIISWGSDGNNEVTDTPLDTNFTAIAVGRYHSMALSVSAVPLPTSAWMGLALLGGIGGYGLIRRRLCSVNTPL